MARRRRKLRKGDRRPKSKTVGASLTLEEWKVRVDRTAADQGGSEAILKRFREILEMRQEGLTYEEIGDKLNPQISRQRVQSLVRKAEELFELQNVDRLMTALEEELNG